jgi:hypothetical protein
MTDEAQDKPGRTTKDAAAKRAAKKAKKAAKRNGGTSK